MSNQSSQRPFTQRQLRVGELVKQNIGELLIDSFVYSTLLHEPYLNFPIPRRMIMCHLLGPGLKPRGDVPWLPLHQVVYHLTQRLSP